MPLSLGIETENNVMSIVFPINTPIPTEREEDFTTSFENQLNAWFRLHEGERAFTTDNKLLDQFSLHRILAAQCGIPELKVVFKHGILKVSSLDEGSEVSNHIIITNDGCRLRKDETERMVFDAKRFWRDDEDQEEAIYCLEKFRGFYL